MYAMKSLDRKLGKELIDNEISILKRLAGHPFITKFVGELEPVYRIGYG